MIITIRSIAVASALLFGVLLFVVLTNPKLVERSAQGFLKAEVQAKMEQRFPPFDQGETSAALRKLSVQLGRSQTELSHRIKDGLPELIAMTIAQRCSCRNEPVYAGKREQLTEITRAVLDAYLKKIGIAQNQLTDIIRGHYDAILAALRLDITIFLATNLAAFAVILLATVVPSHKRPLIILPTALLLTTVIICTFTFIFGTNWFYTILFQDYWGFGYTLFIAGIFGLLVDILLNHGRVTNLIFAPIAVVIPSC